MNCSEGNALMHLPALQRLPASISHARVWVLWWVQNLVAEATHRLSLSLRSAPHSQVRVWRQLRLVSRLGRGPGIAWMQGGFTHMRETLEQETLTVRTRWQQLSSHCALCPCRAAARATVAAAAASER